MVNNPYLNVPAEAPTVWEVDEIDRLRTMDEFLGLVTAADLDSALQAIDPQVVTDGARLLDIGAGPGSVTEDLSLARGVDYFALDANQALLAQRTTEPGRMMLGRSEALPVRSDAFELTSSRAVTAWNANPDDAIAEQLRVTRPGGVAVFSEFDWTKSGITIDSEAFEAGMAARAIILQALALAGFNSQLGKNLGAMVDKVVANSSLGCQRTEILHELPEGDHRSLFLESAGTILNQLRALGPGAEVLATLLASNIEQVKQAESFSLRLPAVVTQVVRKN